MSEVQAVLAAVTGDSMSLKGVTARGRISGLMLSMTVCQAYRNDTAETLETVYTFPLAWGAVLMGLSVEIAGRRLAGTVLPEQEAEARYESAIADGDSPIRVSRSADHLYTATLGNLKPGESAVIEIRYAQLLRVEQGRVRLSLPTTIAPRYGDPLRDAGIPDPESVGASLSVAYPFDLQLAIDGALADGAVASPTHPVSVSRTPSGLRVRLMRAGWLDRDFVLTIAEVAAPEAGGTAQAIRAPDGDGCVVLASFCPSIAEVVERPLALKILVDCSGSMGGDSIAAARRGLARVIDALRPTDRFAYSRFGSSVAHTFAGLRRAAPAALAVARAAIERTDADLGGTEMAGALRATFALEGAPQSDVLLITDGDVWGVEPIVAAAQASGHRVFAVGVGSAPAESLLRRLAESTGGACELVAPAESIEAAVARMFARLRLPPATGLSIDWGTDPAWSTSLPAALFDGDTMHVFAGFATAAAAGAIAPRLSFRLGTDDTAPRTLDAPAVDAGATTAPAGTDDADASVAEEAPAAVLPRLAAHQRIAALAPGRRGRVGMPERPEARALALELALRHQLVTDDTNLFLVHRRIGEDKATDLPALQKIAPMLAAGWGGTGSVHDVLPAVLAHSAASYGVASRRVSRSPRDNRWAMKGGQSKLIRYLEGLSNSSPDATSDPADAFDRTVRGWLDRLRDRLHSDTDFDPLVAELGRERRPAAIGAALSALADAGVAPRSAWALLLAWLAASRGGDAAPGSRAMAVLDALIDALPASVVGPGMSRVAACLAAVETAPD